MELRSGLSKPIMLIASSQQPTASTASTTAHPLYDRTGSGLRFVVGMLSSCTPQPDCGAGDYPHRDIRVEQPEAFNVAADEMGVAAASSRDLPARDMDAVQQ